MGKLTKREMDALQEIDRYTRRGTLYWFREVTMKQLEAKGLVEKWLPPSVAQRPRMKSRPWRVSEAGRALLAQEER